MVTIQKKNQFLQRLIAYWTLKRQYRNGVTLLRTLQSQGQTYGSQNNRSGIEGSPDTSELYQQLKYWQCLRQDLERARLLCELVRKREKLKSLEIKLTEQIVMMELNPLETALGKLLDILQAIDTTEIFHEPVDIREVPDYTDIVKQPMDLSTMRLKIKSGIYCTLDQMEADFDLMIRGCWRAMVEIQCFVGPVLECERVAVECLELEELGWVEVPRTDDVLLQGVEGECESITEGGLNERAVTKLQVLAGGTHSVKGSLGRS